MTGPADIGTTPTVWLHGAGMNGASWGGIPSGMTPDLPGHGDAPRATPATVAGFAEALLVDLPERFNLIGHSLGGMVALLLAAHHPKRVRALVLVETSYGVRTRWIDRLGSDLTMALIRIVGPAGIAWITRLQKNHGSKWAAKQIRRMNRDGFIDAFKAVLTFDGRVLLPRIIAPTLIVVGEDNARTHDQARFMREHIAGAQLETLPGGHLPFIDNPERFERTINSFLQELRYEGTTG